MSIEEDHGPTEFRPVKLGPRRRRLDPLAVGVLLVIGALVLAVVKPWGEEAAELAAVPSLAPSPAESASAVPSASPGEPVDPMALPTWSDVVPVVARHPAWGLRTIVRGVTPATDGSTIPISDRYAEHWYEASENDGGADSTALVDGRDGDIVALGVTFPPEEAPLDVRVWKRHTDGELEWVDARPVDDVPARGATLYVRRGDAGEAVGSWEPGTYRIDVLVGGGIKRIFAQVTNPGGLLPPDAPWTRDPVIVTGLDTSALQLLPQGLFIQAGGVPVPVASEAGPPLDEYGAWLDVDHDTPTAGPRSFVARASMSELNQVGVILPAFSSVRAADLVRIAPAGDSDGVSQTGIGSIGSVSFVTFAPIRGPSWTPGVYALSVAWDDADGPHEATWHIELRPGPVPATPVLLAATRAWARFVGSNGVLLGVPEPLSGTDPLGVTLLEITPQDASGYPGLSGSDLIGCGETLIHGRPEVIGIVGEPAESLTPVASRILYPMADDGQLEILTAAGAVPGLALAAPLMTAELGGPASYGFRAGTSEDSPGYTICIGFGGGG